MLAELTKCTGLLHPHAFKARYALLRIAVSFSFAIQPSLLSFECKSSRYWCLSSCFAIKNICWTGLADRQYAESLTSVLQRLTDG